MWNLLYDNVFVKIWLWIFWNYWKVIVKSYPSHRKNIDKLYWTRNNNKTVLLRDRKRRTARAPHLQKFPKCLSNFLSKILSIFLSKTLSIFGPKFCPTFLSKFGGGYPRAPPPQLGGLPPGVTPGKFLKFCQSGKVGTPWDSIRHTFHSGLKKTPITGILIVSLIEKK